MGLSGACIDKSAKSSIEMVGAVGIEPTTLSRVKAN
jgi:hypothetical protein